MSRFIRTIVYISLLLILILAGVITASGQEPERWKLEVFQCDSWKFIINDGDLLTFQHGIGFGDWETAVAEREGHEAYFFLDGNPISSVYFEGLTEHSPGFYGDRAWADWDTKPGEHTIQSYWSHENEGYPGDTCIFKIKKIPPGKGIPFMVKTLFADGDVRCSGIDDFSTPVGEVKLTTLSGKIDFQVKLKNAAQNWQYYVEFSQDGVCADSETFYGLTTDENGDGILKGSYPLPPGSYLFQVDVVSDPNTNIPPNWKHREISTNGFFEVTIP